MSAQSFFFFLGDSAGHFWLWESTLVGEVVSNSGRFWFHSRISQRYLCRLCHFCQWSPYS